MSNKLAPIDEVKKNISVLTPQFKAALPPHVSVEKFVRTVLTAVQTTPALVSANRQSLYSAAMKCASAGLLPDGKEAALVPFGQEVTHIPMVMGLLKQVRNSGELSSITAQLIYANDKFSYKIDSDGEHLEHEPLLFGDRGELLGVYALAKLKDGAVYVEVLTAKQVGDIRNISKAKNGPAWSGAFVSEMWKKSAIRRLCKRLPISTDREAPALDSENDDFNFAGRDVTIPTTPPPADAPEQIEAPEKTEKKQASRTSQIIKNSAPGAEDIQASKEPEFDPDFDKNLDLPARPIPPNG